MVDLTASFNEQVHRQLDHEFILWLLFVLIEDSRLRNQRHVAKTRANHQLAFKL